jgi:hypothetical protein
VTHKKDVTLTDAFREDATENDIFFGLAEKEQKTNEFTGTVETIGSAPLLLTHIFILKSKNKDDIESDTF